MTVIGLNRRRLYAEPQTIRGVYNEMYNRQSLMFGKVGQYYLSNTRVGIIGLGGVGSLVNEYLARLGVREIVGVDFDRIERSNCSRVVGSRVSDCYDWLRQSRYKWLREIGEHRALHTKFASHSVSRARQIHACNFGGLWATLTTFTSLRNFEMSTSCSFAPIQCKVDLYSMR